MHLCAPPPFAVSRRYALAARRKVGWRMGGGGGGTALPHSWAGSDEHMALQLAAGNGEPAKSRSDARTQGVDFRRRAKEGISGEKLWSSGAELKRKAQECSLGEELRRGA